jgi:hypothetical protein
MIIDDDIVSAKVGKYQNALSNLCGVEYAYMQGDPDVDAIIELIDIFVQQIQTIDEQNEKIKKLQDHINTKLGPTVDLIASYEGISWRIIDEAIDKLEKETEGV